MKGSNAILARAAISSHCLSQPMVGFSVFYLCFSPELLRGCFEIVFLIMSLHKPCHGSIPPSERVFPLHCILHFPGPHSLHSGHEASSRCQNTPHSSPPGGLMSSPEWNILPLTGTHTARLVCPVCGVHTHSTTRVCPVALNAARPCSSAPFA